MQKKIFGTTWSNIRTGITKGLALIVKFRYSEKGKPYFEKISHFFKILWPSENI